MTFADNQRLVDLLELFRRSTHGLTTRRHLWFERNQRACDRNLIFDDAQPGDGLLRLPDHLLVRVLLLFEMLKSDFGQSRDGLLIAGLLEVLRPPFAEEQSQVAFESDVELVHAGQPSVEVLHARAEDKVFDLSHFAYASSLLFLRPGSQAHLLSVSVRRVVAHQEDLRGWIVFFQAPVLDPLHNIVPATLTGILRQIWAQVARDYSQMLHLVRLRDFKLLEGQRQ